jgi:peptidoglycan/LPS O-acetylase OafA/YrhL
MGAIRLFLALIVAVGHLESMILIPAKAGFSAYWRLGMNAGYAVVFFFAISGFLMSMVLSTKYPPTLSGTLSFYRSRALRIFPVYWLVCAIVLIANKDIYAMFLTHSIADKFTNIFILGMDWRLAFVDYPTDHWSAAIFTMHQAWTLSAELTFYILAPFLLRSPKLTAIVFVLAIATRTYIVATTDQWATWAYYFQPATFLFFLLGHYAFRSSRSIALISKPEAGAALLTACVVLLMFPGFVQWDTPRFYVVALCFVMSLPGIFAGTKDNRHLNKLGDLSYPVYLVHLFIITTLSFYGYLAGMSGPAIVGYVLGLTLLAAIAIHVIELAVNKTWQRLAERNRQRRLRNHTAAQAPIF